MFFIFYRNPDVSIDTPKKKYVFYHCSFCHILDADTCSGFNFGFPALKFDDEFESGFGSVGSGLGSALRGTTRILSFEHVTRDSGDVRQIRLRVLNLSWM